MSSLGILSAPNKILKVGQDRSPEVHGSIGSCKSDIFPFDKVCPQLSCVRRCLPPPETEIISDFLRLLIKCLILCLLIWYNQVLHAAPFMKS